MGISWVGRSPQQISVRELVFGRRTPREAIDSLSLGTGQVTDHLDDHEQSLLHRLAAFAAGARDDFADVRLDQPRLSTFQRQVVDQCRRIQWGQTLTYSQLAAIAGYPRAARAVGNVMATNRLPLLVPCHRVVGSAGSLGGYSAPDGLSMKLRLLKREGASLAIPSVREHRNRRSQKVLVS